MEKCNRPPKGWICTREAGHSGPCAAVKKPGLRDRIKQAGQSFGEWLFT